MPDPAILWPYVDVSGNLRITIGGSPEVVALDVSGLQMTAMIAALETAIEAHSAGPTVTVSLLADFTVRVVSSLSFRIEWANAANTFPASVYGFEQTTPVSPTTTFTSPNQVGGLWRPRKGPEDDTGDVTRRLAAAAVAMDGTERVSDFGAPYATRDLYFGLLLPEVTEIRYAAATAPEGTLERAWINSLSRGQALRYAEDEDDLATYTEYVLRDPGMRPITRDERFSAQRWASTLKLRRTS